MFELTFHQPGIYNYKCLIFGNIEGCVEVLSDDEFSVSAEDIKNAKCGSKSICSVGASTDIEKLPGEESLSIIKDDREESIKKIIDKYLKKAKWELPVELALELDKIEKDIPFFVEKEGIDEEDRKSSSISAALSTSTIGKRKRTRNGRRRLNAKKRAFMESLKSESLLLQKIFRTSFLQIWTSRHNIIKDSGNTLHDRSGTIKACMDLSP